MFGLQEKPIEQTVIPCCYFCRIEHGIRRKAAYLAPQEDSGEDPEGLLYAYYPVCEDHAQHWWSIEEFQKQDRPAFIKL